MSRDASTALGARQQRFVEDYLTSLDGMEAALEAANSDRPRRTAVTPERVLRDVDTAPTPKTSAAFRTSTGE
jgi:phage terminase small subunit